ncbi:MAG TPA: 50S ribosomal protein L18 [bacterium]|nr:50S ribosomal protein L18 [bacterium]HNS49282.1 50S ribosomal protein L18 [bacterium]
MIKGKEKRRQMRHRRGLKKIQAKAGRPRLMVRKSLKHIYAILIDDTAGRVITAVSSHTIKGDAAAGGHKGLAEAVGRLAAEAALKKGFKEVIFDRGGYLYHGNVKILAEAARAAGLKF